MKTPCYHLCGKGSFMEKGWVEKDHCVQYTGFTVSLLVGGASFSKVLNEHRQSPICICSHTCLGMLMFLRTAHSLLLNIVSVTSRLPIIISMTISSCAFPFNIYFKFTIYMYVYVCVFMYMWGCTRSLEVLRLLIIVSLSIHCRIWTLVLRIEQQVLLNSDWAPFLLLNRVKYKIVCRKI